MSVNMLPLLLPLDKVFALASSIIYLALSAVRLAQMLLLSHPVVGNFALSIFESTTIDHSDSYREAIFQQKKGENKLKTKIVGKVSTNVKKKY